MSEALEFRSPSAGALKDIGPAAAADVVVCEESKRQAVTIIAHGSADDIAGRLQAAFGLKLVAGSKASSVGNLTFVATGPRAWLALSDEAASLSTALRRALGDSAAVTDQSSGYTVFCVSGAKARATFEKGLGVDLHPRAFGPGDAASTSCAHLNVIIWQIDDQPIYEIAVARSFAAAFCHWLTESAAEFGLKVLP
ncbi:MAG: sarcosine oxidase subunit gamma [Methylovirgula sp.]